MIRHFAKRFEVTENDIQKRLMNIEISMQFHDFMHQQFDHLTAIMESVISKMQGGEINLKDKSDVEFLKKTNSFIDELGKLIVTTYQDSYNTLKTDFTSIWYKEEDFEDLSSVLGL